MQWVSSHGADFEMMLIKKHPPGSGWEFLHDGESVAAQYYRACLLFELQSQIEIAAVRRPPIVRSLVLSLAVSQETELTRVWVVVCWGAQHAAQHAIGGVNLAGQAVVLAAADAKVVSDV